MFDLISIGTISADLYFSTQDLTKKGDRLSLAIGGKYDTDNFEMHVGGGGASVAIGCRKMGLKTTVVGMVGNNVFRKNILQRLTQAKVSTRYIMFDQKEVNVSAILLSPDGERTVIHYDSPHEHSKEEKYTFKHLAKTRAVYFGNLPDVSAAERRNIMKELKKRNVYIFANVGKRDCCKPKEYIKELLEFTDMLIVNTYEFSQLAKKEEKDIDFKKSMLKHLPIMKDKLLVVTDAAQGSYAYEGEKMYYQKAFSPKRIVDTTGAGDAYTAGFISSYLKHDDVQRAMKTGSRYASWNLGNIGAN